MKQKQDLSFWKLWNLSFGFFGVQIAYALQSANISRIFATLGADPHSLSYFWILPPLMGILVQPIVGTLSDRTWCRFGRRIPYLFIGSAVAVAVMCLLPNAGSFGMAVSTAMVFGLISLMFLDTSINMAMQPFKMLVGDMVNEKQKSLAYSIQSFLCNSGSLIGYVFPFFFTAIGIANEAPKGVVPDSVIYSFYIGAAILILCVLYTTLTVKEWNPKEYAEYNERKPEAEEQKAGWLTLLKNAPSMFWKVGLVQFFCWAAFMYMWTYTNGTIADTVWHTTDVSSKAYQEAGNWVGVLFFWQALGSVAWAMVLPRIKNDKFAYAHRCSRICHAAVHRRPEYPRYPIPAHRMCMGCNARHAVCLRDKRLGGIWPQGSLPRTVQRHHLSATDSSGCRGRNAAVARWLASIQHDDRGCRTAGARSIERGHHQQERTAYTIKKNNLYNKNITEITLKYPAQ